MIEDGAGIEWLRDTVPALAALDVAVPDAQRIDAIRALEELTGAAAAAQARMCAAFAASQRAEQAAAGVPAERQGRGIPSQVGLAKRESPSRAARYVGWATILTSELPGTFAALQAGHITEWRAQLVARETGCLSAQHRAQVDRELSLHLETWGDRQVVAAPRTAAYRLDPHGLVARVGRAEAIVGSRCARRRTAWPTWVRCCRSPRGLLPTRHCAPRPSSGAAHAIRAARGS